MNHRYKQMLEGMRVKEERSSNKRNQNWFLYILRCKDQSLYTGITTDIERRFRMHSKGKAAHYTKTRRPLKLVHQEICKTRTQALIRECFVKALSRAKKLALIQNGNITKKRRKNRTEP